MARAPRLIHVALDGGRLPFRKPGTATLPALLEHGRWFAYASASTSTVTATMHGSTRSRLPHHHLARALALDRGSMPPWPAAAAISPAKRTGNQLGNHHAARPRQACRPDRLPSADSFVPHCPAATRQDCHDNMSILKGVPARDTGRYPTLLSGLFRVDEARYGTAPAVPP